MKRAYYSNNISNFLEESSSSILGKLTINHEFALEDLQRNAWVGQIEILKALFAGSSTDIYILFEYAIPRMGKRVDVVLLYNGIVFVLEFKVGEKSYSSFAKDQALDYALDLKNFHEQSHHACIIPIVVATEAEETRNSFNSYEDLVYSPLLANKQNLKTIIDEVNTSFPPRDLDFAIWEDSIYKPTPTIIEAAQALYKGHNVKEISRSDSGAINLSKTSEAIAKIIDHSKETGQKSICFITGVPGAGKTLAGLNIANERHNTDLVEHAVFLSGNGPLVEVLQEALARNEVIDSKHEGKKITKAKALAKTKAFIQNIHHFRDDSIQTERPPVERVAIFDEAQRAWTLEQTSSFMSRKKGISDFQMSEPEFLISVMNRHSNYAVIICLIGGGQEINTGEAGLPEWFSAIERKFPNWNVYVSGMLSDPEYTGNKNIYSEINETKLNIEKQLHLSVSVRSYRSENVSDLVKNIIDNKPQKAKELWAEIKQDYPIVITRKLETARNWLKKQSRGTERIGIVASSGALRLRPHGIHIKSSIDPKNWFLNNKNDIRSSYCLEEAATEFDIQGLELDWTCVAWDADFRFYNNDWIYKKFRGSKWQNVNDKTRRQYLKNAYRVLLTRARQGMIIFIPEGNDEDITRQCEFYDQTYNFLRALGLPCA